MRMLCLHVALRGRRMATPRLDAFPDLSAMEHDMPLIQVSIGTGRDENQLRALVTELTDATVRAIGARREAVTVIVTQVEGTHWANGGVTLADKKAAREAAASAASGAGEPDDA